ncbi:MAG: VWA domain-containing protein [Oscillochloris sp.]|nr:VWA domain-containing protein [Oscillochloris sp.]
MRRVAFVLLFTILASTLAGCGIPGSTANSLNISIAFSPEKEGWLLAQIEQFNQQAMQVGDQRIVVEGINKSSGAARTEIRNGTLAPTIWSPSASTWLEVLKQESGDQNIAVSAEPLVLTPVVIGMWQPMAEAMGWPNQSIGWSDMLALIENPDGWGAYGHPEWGRFSWGHTDPEISTSALSTLLAEFYAAAGKQRGLSIQDVENPAAQQFIRDLGQGIKHYGYNTLIFSENMKKFGMSYISAFPMEEITLIDFNKVNPPPTQLVAIYPREGTFWHDNPFIVMSSATPEQREAAQLFYDFLLSEESQRTAMSFGFRPANINVPLADPISPRYGAQPQGVQTILEVPSAEVIVAAKNAWSLNRKRADIMIVVDTSGSMEGDKIENMRAGLDAFLLRILPEDRVGLISFDSEARVLVPLNPLTDNRIALQGAISEMRARGKTAIFDALTLAQAELSALPQAEDDRITAIVLLSDGADNSSSASLDDVRLLFEESGISIFPVAYGADADEAVVAAIADFSRTIVVKGDSGDIAQIFENLSRYF